MQPERGFSKEYLPFIEEHFAQSIERKKPVTLASCRDFLRKHPTNRSAKQIQDKVKNLIKAIK